MSTSEGSPVERGHRDAELYREQREAEALRDAQAWHYRDRGEGVPWGVLALFAFLFLVWTGLIMLVYYWGRAVL